MLSGDTQIKLVVVDLDGTLLNSESQLSERNEKALKAAMDKGVQVVIATGKTRYSATDVIKRLGLTTPGIYLQGLAIYNADGTIGHQQTLDAGLARQVITFAEDRGFDVVAYSGSRILVKQANPKGDELAAKYGEPVPEAVGPLQNILGEMAIHKLIVTKANDARKVKALRWQLSKQIDTKGRLVQAMIPDMLEVLPAGASKGAALRVLLKQMGISAAEMMVIGDGENDLEMVQMAAIGIAVGNGYTGVKDIATEVVGTNDEDGVAQAIEKYVLGGPVAATSTEEASANGAAEATTDTSTEDNAEETPANDEETEES